MSNNNLLAEDVITLDRLQEFLTHCDDRYIFTSNPPDFGLSINGHTISIVSGGSNKSVTVPDNDTTYTSMSSSEGYSATSTTGRLISANELRNQIFYFLDNVTWRNFELEDPYLTD